MPNLFMVLLGGKHPRAKIEVHDLVFATGETLQDTYNQLREQWFGLSKGLHIDAWMRVEGLEGYQIHLSPTAPAAGELRLYAINLGGYVPEEFGEAHTYGLVVAENAFEAKQKAKRQLIHNWYKPHTDAVIDVDDCLPVDFVNGSHVHLVEGEHPALNFENDYIVIGQ